MDENNKKQKCLWEDKRATEKKVAWDRRHNFQNSTKEWKPLQNLLPLYLEKVSVNIPYIIFGASIVLIHQGYTTYNLSLQMLQSHESIDDSMKQNTDSVPFCMCCSTGSQGEFWTPLLPTLPFFCLCTMSPHKTVCICWKYSGHTLHSAISHIASGENSGLHKEQILVSFSLAATLFFLFSALLFLSHPTPTLHQLPFTSFFLCSQQPSDFIHSFLHHCLFYTHSVTGPGDAVTNKIHMAVSLGHLGFSRENRQVNK